MLIPDTFVHNSPIQTVFDLGRVTGALSEAIRDWRQGDRNLTHLSGRILIASIPRCGSTLLVRAIGGFPAGQRLPRHRDVRFVRDLSVPPPAVLQKTHSPAPDNLPEDMKVIFLFCDPVAAVASTLRNRFDRRHFRNCGYRSSQPPDIISRDDLGYERIWDTWNAQLPFPVLYIRFEALWQNRRLIEDYLDTTVNLPTFKGRQTNVEPPLRHRLESTYVNLVDKIAKAPDVLLVHAD